MGGGCLKFMKSCIPWVGGKGQMLWLLHLLAPKNVDKFVDVFGGSGTVVINNPAGKTTLEVYNDYNHNLTNLFSVIKHKPLELIEELNFLPLNSRDDFEALCKFFRKEEFSNGYLATEIDLANQYFEPEDAKTLIKLMFENEVADVKRAAMYYKLIRYSYNSNTKTFGGRSCSLNHFFGDIWDLSRRFQHITVENKDCVAVINQYDGENTLIYSDPPYYNAEQHYDVIFGRMDHLRLHRKLAEAKGFVMVSYNNCKAIRNLYKDFFITKSERPNSMSKTAGAMFEELIITNYDPRKIGNSLQVSLFSKDMLPWADGKYELIHAPKVALKEIKY